MKGLNDFMVQEFMDTFHVSKDQALWRKLFKEEAKEVVEAAEHFLKELADFMYVVTGNKIVQSTFLLTEEEAKASSIFSKSVSLFNTDILIEAFKRVHASNMSKLGADGIPLRREDGKILKGPNYKEPYLSDLI